MRGALIKQPSAWLPFSMSAAALGLLVLHLARYGVTHDADEGTSAHLFQILMAGQILFIGYFALRWLPENPRQTIGVVALQIGAMIPPFAVLYWFEHFAR